MYLSPFSYYLTSYFVKFIGTLFLKFLFFFFCLFQSISCCFSFFLLFNGQFFIKI